MCPYSRRPKGRGICQRSLPSRCGPAVVKLFESPDSRTWDDYRSGTVSSSSIAHHGKKRHVRKTGVFVHKKRGRPVRCCVRRSKPQRGEARIRKPEGSGCPVVTKGSVCPVGTCPKGKTTRSHQPKRVRATAVACTMIEVAEHNAAGVGDPEVAHETRAGHGSARNED